MSKIQIETFYPFPVTMVWEVLTTPEALKQWLMENDFRPELGARFQFRAKPQPGWRGVVDCEVTEFEKPSKLSYTWKGAENGSSTVVVWELTGNDNGTRLVFTHHGFKGLGGLVLSKFILGRGWKRMLQNHIPLVLEHVQNHGMKFSQANPFQKTCDD